jgi:hypothetical protein
MERGEDQQQRRPVSSTASRPVVAGPRSGPHLGIDPDPISRARCEPTPPSPSLPAPHPSVPLPTMPQSHGKQLAKFTKGSRPVKTLLRSVPHSRKQRFPAAAASTRELADPLSSPSLS